MSKLRWIGFKSAVECRSYGHKNSTERFFLFGSVRDGGFHGWSVLGKTFLDLDSRGTSGSTQQDPRSPEERMGIATQLEHTLNRIFERQENPSYLAHESLLNGSFNIEQNSRTASFSQRTQLFVCTGT